MPKSFVLTFAITAWFFTSCKNDVEINAPHKTLPYVFGLMNPYDSVHYIRIQRSFLGDQDPTSYSRNPDSIYFKKVDAVIEEIVSDKVLNTYPLTEVVISSKNSGMFSNPDLKVYTFAPPSLNPGAKYRLSGTADGIKINATTEVLNDNDPVFGNSGPSSFGRFWNMPGWVQFATSTNLNDGLTVKFNAPYGSREIRVDLIFYYYEEYEDGTSALKHLQMNFGTQSFSDLSKINVAELTLSPDRFYEQISLLIPDKNATPNLKQRIPHSIDFEFGAIDENTYYYRDVNSPSSDLVQEKAQFTNIEDGIGIFGSRLIVSMRQWTKKAGFSKGITTLERNSQIELAGGRIASEKGLPFNTSKKGFCVEKELAASSPADLVCK